MRDCRPVDHGVAQPVRWLERSSRRLRVEAYQQRRSGFEASHLGYLIFRRGASASSMIWPCFGRGRDPTSPNEA